MLISVKVKQILDGEVVIDDIVRFHSVEEFRENLKLAHQNWQSMWGKYCVINTYSDAIAPGCCFYGMTTSFDGLERWEIIDIDKSEKTKSNLIIDVNHVMYSSEPGGTYDEYSIVDANTMNVYARTSYKDVAEIILNALKTKREI